VALSLIMNIKNLQRSHLDFWTTIDTRWRDMDSLGHINHAAYLTYMESARVDVYIKMGYSGIRKEMDESAILAGMTVEYLSQANHPSILDIGHRISRVGSKSFDFVSGVFLKGDDKPVCTALFKMVSFNYKLNQSIEVPETIKHFYNPL